MRKEAVFAEGNGALMSNQFEDARTVEIPRREFLHNRSAAAGAVIASSVVPQATAQGTGGKQPNRAFFYTEGHGADALSLAGNLILKTPHQEGIGCEGVYFTDSFCTNALCISARAVTLIGLHSNTASRDHLT